MRKLENLYPERVFYYFEQIAGIPHGSGNTKQISDYLVDFAREHGLVYRQDASNNVIMIKAATAGYETAEPVIIQGHMDMVCEKESGCAIDFERDGLELCVEDGWVRANGTTLGADDGIAVAYALALLESDTLSHPRLEVVITVDEEVGMLGARDLDVSELKGRRMLNIDSEEEGHFLTSCAGGMGLAATIPLAWTHGSGRSFTLTVSGLAGGHSGGEIHKERGNADILMGRALGMLREQAKFGIAGLAGGLKDNAIPRECTAQILVPEGQAERIAALTAEISETFRRELAVSDAKVMLLCEDRGSAEAQVLEDESAKRVIFYLRTVPNGVLHRSQAMPELVETSLNLGILKLRERGLYTLTSIRSSVGSRKEEVRARVTALVEMLGGETEVGGDYPAWEYRQDSPLREQIARVYGELFHQKPLFDAIHAGLECGLFSDKLPGLDCVSFGPDMQDIHTPKERLSIASVGRMWDFLVAFLAQAK